jgi:hypothetical protein
MPTRPDSPDPTGTAGASTNPFAQLGSDMGKGMDFIQDWMKAAGSALPHVSAASTSPGGMPGWSMPTLDPAELDKRIQELKTVQFWLEQNARMVAMSIQALEVQRMTLSTLQGMNVSMDQLKESLKVKPDAFRDFFKPPAPAPDAPAKATAPAAERAPEPAPAPASPAPADLSKHSAWFQGAPEVAEGTAADGGSDDAPAGTAGEGEGEAAPPAADLINPLRWWDTLTQQFSHLASQAAGPMAGPKVAPAPGPMATAKARSTPTQSARRKPAAKKAAARKAASRSAAEAQAPAASPRAKPKARS